MRWPGGAGPAVFLSGGSGGLWHVAMFSRFVCAFALLLSGQPSVSYSSLPYLGTLVVLIPGIGLPGTAMAYPVGFKVLEPAVSVKNLLLVTIIVPVFMLSLDALLLGQLVSRSAMAGFGPVAFGPFVMDGRL